MRLALKINLLLVVIATIIPAPAYATGRQLRKYPLRVRFYRSRSPSWDTVVSADDGLGDCCADSHAKGLANIRNGNEVIGTTFDLHCEDKSADSLPLRSLEFPARWKQQGKTLEVIMDPFLGQPRKTAWSGSTCRMKVQTSPHPWE